MSEPHDPNDVRPPESPDGEERAMVAALAVLEAGDPERGLEEAIGVGEAADSDATLRRLYVETLGLLAWEARSQAPPEELKARLMAAIAIPSASSEPHEEPAAEGAAPAPGSGSNAPRWLAALAAVLAVAGIGLAGWFYVQLDRSQESLARIDAERTRLAQRLDRQEEIIRRSAGMGEFLSAVSTAGVEICPLRPVGDPALHPQAFAILYMPPGSGEWYLLATNLKPGEGVYKVWLNTPDGPVAVGFLEPGDESALEIELPPDIDQRHELMLSIVVTLEPAPDMPDPSGPMILFGDEVMKVL